MVLTGHWNKSLDFINKKIRLFLSLSTTTLYRLSPTVHRQQKKNLSLLSLSSEKHKDT